VTVGLALVIFAAPAWAQAPEQILDYTVVYRVEGTLNGFADHEELYWNAIGNDWEVPIQQASVTVSAPAPISQVACYVGPIDSTRPCGSSKADGRSASFAATGLGSHEGLTVVVGLPTGALPAPQPVLEERWSLARAFSATPGTLTMAGGVLLAVLLVLGWLFGIVGRERRPGAGAASVAGTIVESAPPEGIRPAQAGLLVDEVVNPVAIPATVVDLAVRGYPRIEEDPANDDWERLDWRLVKLKPADKDVLDYERVLLDGLFASRRRRAADAEAVWLSELEKDFYHRSRLVRSRLYQDAVQRGWFSDHPDEVQQRWRLRMIGARRMPRRTPAGAELLRRVNGFRAYLQPVGVDRADPAQAADQFSPYLPYAIMFGLTEQWTRTFELVGAPPKTPWFDSHRPYTPHRFRNRIHRFSSSSAAILTATPPAVSGSSGFGSGGSGSSGGGGGGFSGGGGGGFSGGGGGGGGGGSW
jgi:Predicted membrane protein (DUF2207)